MYKQVTRKEHSSARQYAHHIFYELHRGMKPEYIFYTRYVGSGKWGTVIRDMDNRYDLDYQIILTKNSQYYKNNKNFDPTLTKNKFFGKIESILDEKGLENSTTAITFNNPKIDYSLDFVIIDGTTENDWKIIRRNNKDSKNEYAWNEIPSSKIHLDYYKALPETERYKLAQQIMKHKAVDKGLPDNEKEGSYIVTMRVINEHRTKNEFKK